MTLRIGVLSLQGDVREHAAMLALLEGVTVTRVRSPGGLQGLDGLVIPGGESTTISMLAVRWGLMEPLRAAAASGLPIFGSCAGMILLADTVLDGRADQQSIGGIDMVVRRNAFGRQVDSFEADIPFQHIAGGPVRGVFIRAPWVESVGPGVEVLATLPSDRPGGADRHGRIVAVRSGNLLATAFHPELTGDPRVHGLFVALVRAARGWGAGDLSGSAQAVAEQGGA